MTTLSCFNFYTLRGHLGEELNEMMSKYVDRFLGLPSSACQVAVGCNSLSSSLGLAVA